MLFCSICILKIVICHLRIHSIWTTYLIRRVSTLSLVILSKCFFFMYTVIVLFCLFAVGFILWSFQVANSNALASNWIAWTEICPDTSGLGMKSKCVWENVGGLVLNQSKPTMLDSLYVQVQRKEYILSDIDASNSLSWRSSRTTSLPLCAISSCRTFKVIWIFMSLKESSEQKSYRNFLSSHYSDVNGCTKWTSQKLQ